MFKVKSNENLKDMGFVEKNNKGDLICVGIDDVGDKRMFFKIYAGSSYIRNATSPYTIEKQMKLIHEWTKKDYIEWEE